MSNGGVRAMRCPDKVGVSRKALGTMNADAVTRLPALAAPHEDTRKLRHRIAALSGGDATVTGSDSRNRQNG